MRRYSPRQGAEVLCVKVVSVKLGVVTPMEMVLEGHLIFLEQGRPSGVVVKKALWLRDGTHGIFAKVSGMRGPVAMGCFVLAHQKKRLVGIFLLVHPFNGKVGDLIGTIALVSLPRAIHLNEVRVVVAPLTRENFPVIKPRGISSQMPFANHSRVVSRLAEDFRKGGLSSVKSIPISEEPIEVTGTSEDAGMKDRNGVGTEGIDI